MALPRALTNKYSLLTGGRTSSQSVSAFLVLFHRGRIRSRRPFPITCTLSRPGRSRSSSFSETSSETRSPPEYARNNIARSLRPEVVSMSGTERRTSISSPVNQSISFWSARFSGIARICRHCSRQAGALYSRYRKNDLMATSLALRVRTPLPRSSSRKCRNSRIVCGVSCSMSVKDASVPSRVKFCSVQG